MTSGTARTPPAGPAAGDREIAPPRHLPPWALPGELAVLDGWPAGRRTVRDWLSDAGLFVAASLLWWLNYSEQVAEPDPAYLEVVPAWMIVVDPWLGAAAVLALWTRRRAPIALGIVMVAVMIVSSTGYGAVLVIILTLAIHRGWAPATAVAVAVASLSVLFSFAWQPQEMGRTAFLVTSLLLIAAPLSWGLVVRFRRQLIVNLRLDAQRRRDDERRRLQEARYTERQRIAWEMHDVLAHRISLVSVHAGALAFRCSPETATSPASDEEIRAAVQVIRDNAHQALDELGEVLSVLRADDADGDVRAALPLLSDLPELFAEARAAGQRVVGEMHLDAAVLPRPQEQRTVYRVVQEGLTNARKHAPGAPVDVRVEGAPGQGVTVTIANPMTGAAPAAPPGSGTGLTGLRERVELDGGTLDHGDEHHGFRLVAQLPWSL